MFTTLILAIAVGAPGPKAEAKKDPPTVVGKWVPETGNVGGKPDTPPPGTTFEFTADGTFLMLTEGNARPEASSYTTDAKKDPAEIDVAGPGPGGKKGPAILGIYKVDGDTLTLAMSKDGTRPTKFESPAGSRVMLMTLKRAKKE
ncbi:MAG TPA: TIGR03067 domain-containing protein [Gemmataceae bacterium]|jgi:uncharacterized protein (TIGR03067 family)|nr:TIGR03067 domain-containing protein [Gemmataceae bacterium]